MIDSIKSLMGCWGQDSLSDQKTKKSLKAETSDNGKIIRDIFRDNEGNIIATEVATRVDTVDLIKKGLESKREYLVQKLGETSDSEAEAKLARLIKETDRAIKNHSNLKGSWGSNFASRFAFKTLLNPKEEYSPILCNLRTHKVYHSETENASTIESSINRSASVTDFAHGEISLQELKDYKLLLKLRDVDPETDTRLINLYKIGKNKGLEKAIADMKKRIVASYGSDAPQRLDEIIEQRENVLKDLILQDLYTHFKDSPPKGKEVFYGRVGLLDTVKDPVKEERGLVLHERTQALDMKAIYDQLQGAKVIFDGKEGGFFFDENGNIHMPKEFNADANHEKELNTLFLNVSVQRHKKNTGAQKFINDDAKTKLENWKRQNKLSPDAIKAMDQFYAVLDNGKVNAFERADKAVQILSNLGLTSVNCFGGKDRTGYALATVTYRMLEKLVPKPSAESNKTEQKKHTALMNRLARQLIKKDGVATKVATDCNGHTVLKLSQYNLPLYVPKSLSGSGLRISAFLGVVGMKLKSAQGHSPEQVYAAPAA